MPARAAPDFRFQRHAQAPRSVGWLPSIVPSASSPYQSGCEARCNPQSPSALSSSESDAASGFFLKSLIRAGWERALPKRRSSTNRIGVCGRALRRMGNRADAPVIVPDCCWDTVHQIQGRIQLSQQLGDGGSHRPGRQNPGSSDADPTSGPAGRHAACPAGIRRLHTISPP